LGESEYCLAESCTSQVVTEMQIHEERKKEEKVEGICKWSMRTFSWEDWPMLQLLTLLLLKS